MRGRLKYLSDDPFAHFIAAIFLVQIHTNLSHFETIP